MRKLLSLWLLLLLCCFLPFLLLAVLLVLFEKRKGETLYLVLSWALWSSFEVLLACFFFFPLLFSNLLVGGSLRLIHFLPPALLPVLFLNSPYLHFNWFPS
jgi:hypothetical protein